MNDCDDKPEESLSDEELAAQRAAEAKKKSNKMTRRLARALKKHPTLGEHFRRGDIVLARDCTKKPRKKRGLWTWDGWSGLV